MTSTALPQAASSSWAAYGFLLKRAQSVIPTVTRWLTQFVTRSWALQHWVTWAATFRIPRQTGETHQV